MQNNRQPMLGSYDGTLTVGIFMAKMGWFLGGFLVLTIGIGILATIPPG